MMRKNIINAIIAITWLLQPLNAKEDKNSTLVQHACLSHNYFAYGSNLSHNFLKERLKNGQWIDEWHKDGELIGHIPIDLGSFELLDYEFSYSLNVESFGEEGTAGNIIPKKDAKVYGIVYRLSDTHLVELDKTEDVPEAYTRVAVKVHRCAKNILSENNFSTPLIAWVYVGNPKYVVQKENPDPVYVDLLIKSACERSFPPEYIEKYLDIKSKEITSSQNFVH